MGITNDPILTGINLEGDRRLLADLGVTLAEEVSAEVRTFTDRAYEAGREAGSAEGVLRCVKHLLQAAIDSDDNPIRNRACRDAADLLLHSYKALATPTPRK